MRSVLTAALGVSLGVLAASASQVVADTTATTSISQFKVLEPGDPSFKLFHGAVWLEYDKATMNYRWGGLQCKGRELSDTSIQLLFAAFRSEYQVTVEYVVSEYKAKQYRCLTSFTISKS
ncbi:MAG: hypothetical protein H0T79_09120 [Deltaproteobacteria bacterium]|nr:hypothetical protein [Deltaproteobacteria bacterium]